MKFALTLAVAGGVFWIAPLTPAAAQNDPYRWCAELGGGSEGGFSNCSFVTRAQCEATVSGIGGFCRLNHFYTGPATDQNGESAPPRRPAKKRTPR
jgi:hypothetical protein